MQGSCRHFPLAVNQGPVSQFCPLPAPVPVHGIARPAMVAVAPAQFALVPPGAYVLPAVVDRHHARHKTVHKTCHSPGQLKQCKQMRRWLCTPPSDKESQGAGRTFDMFHGFKQTRVCIKFSFLMHLVIRSGPGKQCGPLIFRWPTSELPIASGRPTALPARL